MRSAPLRTGNQTLLTKCWIATSFGARLVGLMFRKGIAAEEGVCFPKCNSIHTFFMRFPIDIVFVAPHGEVVEIVEGLRPWRLLLPRKGVAHTLELSAGRCHELGIIEGMSLRCEGAWK